MQRTSQILTALSGKLIQEGLPRQGVRSVATSTLLGKELPSKVKIVEVGPRDGLQNEKGLIPTDVKVALINGLASAGLPVVEATSFVSPKWVPQLADAGDVLAKIERMVGTRYPVLTPNMKGLENALKAGATEVAVFPAASEEFSKRNLNCSVNESLKKFGAVIDAARAENCRVRGYVSVAIACPYSGPVAPQVAAGIARALYEMGCYEVSMGDTIGVATPASTERLFAACLDELPAERLAAHMHDTYGQAIANISTALMMGVSVIDSSVAGLGGCPYAEGATGNVSTEDVVFLLDGLGIEHGININQLLDCSKMISSHLGRQNSSRTARALIATRQ